MTRLQLFRSLWGTHRRDGGVCVCVRERGTVASHALSRVPAAASIESENGKREALIECSLELARPLSLPLNLFLNKQKKRGEKNSRQALPRTDREKGSRAGLRRNRVLRAPRSGAGRERRNSSDLDLLFFFSFNIKNSTSARRRRGQGALRLDPEAPRPFLDARRALQRARLAGLRPVRRLD